MIWRGIGGPRPVVVVTLLLVAPAGGSAQQTEFDWSTEAGMLGANALLGGVGAGVAA